MDDFLQGLVARLSMWNVIVGLVLLALGALLALCAERFAYFLDKDSAEERIKRITVVCQLAGLILAVVGFILIMVFPFKG